jgi:exopolysaccharide biosynthesis protein
MRSLTLLIAAAGCVAPAQSWEKVLAPGVTYRMEVRLDPPRAVHVLRLRAGAEGVELRPVLAGGKVFEAEGDGRAILSEVVRSESALAGVNADFFPWSGDPLGAMVVDGEIVSRPYPGRSVLAWGGKAPAVARLGWSGSVAGAGGPVKLSGLNEELGPEGAVLFTAAGGHVRSRGPAVVAVLEHEGKFTPEFRCQARVTTVLEGPEGLAVRSGQLAVAASGQAAEAVRAWKRGDKVSVSATTTGLDWSVHRHAVSGGPAIVTSGQRFQAWDAEGFETGFATSRHPRTALGFTASGDLVLAVVDGRQAHSRGATLDELAMLMVSLGCMEAINLDGGGSAQMAFDGLMVNRPSDGLERPVANALLVYATRLRAEAKPAIVGRSEVTMGQGADFRATLDGKELPGASIVWSASGAAWIDQSGRLRPTQPGTAVVRAWVGGQTAELTVKVLARGASAGPR